MWIKTSYDVLLNMDHCVVLGYESKTNLTSVMLAGETKTIPVSNGNTLPTITGALRCGKSYLEVNDCE